MVTINLPKLPPFLVDLGERTASSFAETLAAFLAVGVPIYAQNWQEALGISATVALMTFCKGVAASRIGGMPATAGFLPLNYTAKPTTK
jgi:hypothetical protein